MVLAREEQFVPEKRLERIEADAVVGKKADLFVRSLDVFLVITVDEEYVFGREVDASYLCADDGEKQL